MYPRILEDIASVQNTSVWDVRGLTRKAEQKREMYDSPLDMQGRPEPNFHRFHEIARHAIHGTETLDTAIKTTQHMIEHHATFQADMCESLDAQLSKQAHRMIHERLKAYQTFFEAQLNRAISNKDRLQNEIKLSFNRVAQYDAGHSLEIAKAARDDSESMSTIGFVTMLFLPATFVAAIFSTSFFSFEPGDGWQVSSEFWRYWAFALPITALTGASWLCRRVLWETWNTFLGSCRFPFSQTDKAAK
jgi:Mg2+ and Co2+ transporter CorA